MPVINFLSQPKSFQVYFLNKSTLDQSSKKILLESLSFAAKYKQVCILPESKEIYIGTELKSTTTNFDPFFKINPIQLGATLYKKLGDFKEKSINIKNQPPLENIDTNKFFEDFVLGFLQASYKFDKFLKEDTNKSDLEISFDQEIATFLDSELKKKILIFNEGLNLTRELVNDTPENINPQTMPEIIKKELATKNNIAIKNLFEISTHH